MGSFGKKRGKNSQRMPELGRPVKTWKGTKICRVKDGRVASLINMNLAPRATPARSWKSEGNPTQGTSNKQVLEGEATKNV